MGFCKGKGGGVILRAAAVVAITAIVGPAGAAIAIPFLAQVKDGTATPSQVLANKNAIEANKQIDSQNKSRDDLINKYVNSMAPPNANTIAIGTAFHDIHDMAVAEYGNFVSTMSLNELNNAHPDIVAKGYSDFQSQFPELASTTLYNFMADIPDDIKNLPMDALLKILPSSSTKVTLSSSGAISGTTIAIAGGLLVLLITLVMVSKKRR